MERRDCIPKGPNRLSKGLRAKRLYPKQIVDIRHKLPMLSLMLQLIYLSSALGLWSTGLARAVEQISDELYIAQTYDPAQFYAFNVL